MERERESGEVVMATGTEHVSSVQGKKGGGGGGGGGRGGGGGGVKQQWGDTG